MIRVGHGACRPYPRGHFELTLVPADIARKQKINDALTIN